MEPAVIDDTRFLPTIELTKVFTSPEGGKNYRNESEPMSPPRRCSGTWGSTPPRSIPERLPRGPRRRDRRAGRPEHDGPRGARRHQRPEDRDRPAPVRRRQWATPPSFITLDGLRRQGWQQIPAGWLLESSRPRRTARSRRHVRPRPTAGLAIEVREEGILQRDDDGHRDGRGSDPGTRHLGDDRWPDPQRERRRPRTWSRPGRPPASGARSRRPLPARWRCSARSWASPVPTSPSALYYDDLGYLSDVPIVYLALAIVGVPLAAAAAAALAGREPPAIARQVIE